MTELGWRQLPDGTMFNNFTGDLQGYDVEKESMGRRMAERAGLRRPQPAGAHPPTPTQLMVQVPQVPGGQGPRELINPNPNLALNPYYLGLGRLGDTTTPAAPAAAPLMSDTMKRILLAAGIIGAAAGAVWLTGKFKQGPKKTAPKAKK